MDVAGNDLPLWILEKKYDYVIAQSKRHRNCELYIW